MSAPKKRAAASLDPKNPWAHETHVYLTPEAIADAIESSPGNDARATVQQVVLEALASNNCEDAGLCAHMAAFGSTDHKWRNA